METLGTITRQLGMSPSNSSPMVLSATVDAASSGR